MEKWVLPQEAKLKIRETINKECDHDIGNSICINASAPFIERVAEQVREGIDCHGKITFTGKKIPFIDEASEGFYIGWDYAHYGDFFGANPFMRDKKYTTEEIFEDALNVVKQLKKLERKRLDDRKNEIK